MNGQDNFVNLAMSPWMLVAVFAIRLNFIWRMYAVKFTLVILTKEFYLPEQS
ncbi:hypothetical protein SAMN02745219_00825 [Desulfofundulus thermosubterraneus DSM 16057]|uniref:Uncharacterized protein n=1 Tax=Desulfofundulus thermosubterraneus DSM 16057 TaxID=1121432 RepID=A0A1M6D4T7_9FIRM|nr:hypothetical protein SAMN02745219_00825 [Desulfofundulus thermosubterraneus DSM 16057]